MRLLGTTALLALTANAATIRVDVGKSGLAFSPSTITAAKGDILDFHFFAINHSAVAGDFNSPCQPASSGGFFSGFMPVSGGGEGVSSICSSPAALQAEIPSN
jgi:plastocyanin